jgi:hypothetical protein
MFSEDDLKNVLRIVLPENKGNILTESLMLGIEAAVLGYLNAISNKSNLTKDPESIWMDEEKGE